ncbi:MAG: TonB family protein, partial [Myxococcales bacterium]|nr:TonB family protein [Myxococcales bacterium]
MPRLRPSRSGRLAAVLAALMSGIAEAQEGPVLEPPELERGVRPATPEGALGVGEHAEVVLTLLVGTDGAVQEAQIATSAGELLDAAALEAAEGLVFRPATRDGEPIPARIRFAIGFDGPEPPPEPEPPPPEPTTGVLEGRVRGPDDAPLE